MVSSPPPDPEHHEGNQHDDFIYPHDDTGRQRREPQLRCVLLHVRHLVHARLLHRRLDKVGVRRARVGDIGLRLQARVHRVADMNQFLHLLELVRDLRGFGFVQVMGVTANTVGDIREEVQKTPVAPAARHAGICRRVPPAEDERHGQRPEKFHNVQRFVLDHHLVSHACRHDDGEQGGQGHAHLQNPPVTPSG